jgi:hypothetical protein
MLFALKKKLALNSLLKQLLAMPQRLLRRLRQSAAMLSAACRITAPLQL